MINVAEITSTKGVELAQKQMEQAKNQAVWIYRCGETACPEDWKPQVRA